MLYNHKDMFVDQSFGLQRVRSKALLDMSLFHFRNALLKQVAKSLVSAESSLKLISKAE